MKKLQDLCRPGKTYPEIFKSDKRQHPHERIQRWQNYLNWLSGNNPRSVEWRQLVFQHKPNPEKIVEVESWGTEKGIRR
jgi:hypothetical protein